MAAKSVTPTADNPVLGEIVRRLVDTYQPERIYLFGSAARGETTSDSDYDLLVIVSDDADKQQRDAGRAYRSLHGIGVPADVLVWRKRYFEERLCLRSSLSSTVAREGKLLYAR